MTIEEVEKRCKGKCKEIKPLSKFHKGGKGPNSRRPKCAKCTSEARYGRGAVKVHEPQQRISSDCMKAWWV